MNAATQTLENMHADTLSTSTLTRLAANDYVGNLPDDFWSPVFGQPNNRDQAYEFNFEQWQAHYQERKRVMQTFIEDWLRHSGSILESFSDDRPTADFTEAYRNGCCDTLWSLKGTRRIDIHGTISNYSRPFLDKAMTAAYLANHLASRLFAFNMRIATWLEPPSMLPALTTRLSTSDELLSHLTNFILRDRPSTTDPPKTSHP